MSGQQVRASAMQPTEHAMTLAVLQLYADTERRIAEMDARRQEMEDHRSRRRNRNRLLVLAVGLSMATLWPTVMPILGAAVLLRWTTALAFIAEAIETSYAYLRRY